MLSIAESLEEKQTSHETGVFQQGDESDGLYLIYNGSVQVVRQKDGNDQIQARLNAGDIFGEEELITGKPRLASVIADANTVLFRIPPALFKILLKQIPRLKYTLEVDIRSHRLSRALHFDWLGEDEVIYFLARKHWVILLEWLIAPALGMGVTSFLLVWGVLTHATIPAYAGGILIWLVLGWGVWKALDWSNDYYLITNQRVIWLEKVIGLYDSRQEAPLSTVLAVGVDTDLVGRMLDYGTVAVRTFVGRIEFGHVSNPYEAAHLVTEHWERSKTANSDAEKQAMTNVLRDRLGRTAQVQPQEAPRPAEFKPASRSVLLALTKLMGGNLFKIRLEDSGTITYRKHWYVLLRQIWQPSFFFFILLVWTLMHGFDLLAANAILQHTLDGRTLPDTILLAQIFGLFLFSLWWIYQFWDWRNDIFQVTPDQILDIDKKPFGTEERRAAPLDNILSTQYSRIGLAGYIFNFGTVYITVGGTQLAFEDVSDPASVQADIDRRRITNLARKNEAEARRERERMADWLAAYHEHQKEFEEGQELSKDEK